MKHSYSSIEYENLKHRFRKGAVLSGLGIMFGIIFLFIFLSISLIIFILLESCFEDILFLPH